MNNNPIKVDAIEEDLEMNKTSMNETKNEDIGEDSDGDEELDDDEFEVEHILNVAAMDGEVKYQVRWKGYGSDEDSWEPEQNLETARLILNEYIANHQDEVKKAQEAVLSRSKLRKRRGNRTKRNKGNKLRRSCSSEYSETTKTMKLRARKKVKMEYEDDGKTDSDEDEGVFKKRGRRCRAVYNKMERTKIVDLSKNIEDESLPKDLSPKKAKNAWLYDDAEDADSDISEGSGRTKKSDIFLRKTKDNNQMRENNITEGSNVSLVTPEEQCENNLDEKVNLLNERRKQKGKGRVPAKASAMEENYESKVEFIGVVQCHDGEIKVIYTKNGETRAHVVSVREAFEIDGFGLVQYFVSRCEFGKPQSIDV
ncbi:Chromo (CHRromatin Organization MOdifier) domain family protein [Acanthocheilonema viteae]